MIRNSGRTVLLVLVALGVILSGAAGPAAAATPTIDQETTNTSTQSDVTNGATITSFNASSSTSTFVEATFDSAPSGDAKLEILDPSTGDKVSEYETIYSNSTADVTNQSTNNYAWNITHDELEKLPVEANTNKTFTFRILDTGDEANATTFDVTIAPTGERSVIYVGDHAASDAGDIASTSEKHPTLGQYIDRYDTSTASIDAEDVATDGDNTTFYVYLQNESVQSAYGEAVSDSMEDGAFLPMMTVTENGNYVPVYLNEKPSSSDYLDKHAYGVYESSSNRIVVYPNGDEDLSGETAVDVSSQGNEGLGFWTTASSLNDLGASWTTAFSNAFDAPLV